MAKRKTRKTSRRAPSRKGASLRMGEGENFGKGQQRRTQATRSGARRVRGEAVTREPQVLGLRGSRSRPDERKQKYDYSDELEQGF